MDETFINRVTEIINANLHNPEFGIIDLSREVGMSRSQLHRKLQILAGKTPSRFIRSLRLKKAKVLLANKVGNVSEIADRTGFSSLSYFSQVFIEEFGYPPSLTKNLDHDISRDFPKSSNLPLPGDTERITPAQQWYKLSYSKFALAASIIIILILSVIFISNKSQSEDGIAGENKNVDPRAREILMQAYDVRTGRGFEEDAYTLQRVLTKRALAIDSNYIEAWQLLASNELSVYNFGWDRSKAQKEKIRFATSKLYSMGKNLPDIKYFYARYLYQVEKDYPASLLLWEDIEKNNRGSVTASNYIGLTYRRMGNFEKAIEKFRSIINEQPLSPIIWYNLGGALERIGRFEDAKRAFEKVKVLSPGFKDVYPDLAWVEIALGKNPEKVREIWGQDFLKKERWIDFIEFEVLERNFAKAKQLWNLAPEDEYNSQPGIIPKCLGIALIDYISENDSSRILFDRAIDKLDKKLNLSKDDWRIYASLGAAYAGLDQKDKALASMKRMLELGQLDNDALDNYHIKFWELRINIMLGNYDQAIEILKDQLNKGSFFSDNFLKLHPLVDPLRSYPEFQALVSSPVGTRGFVTK